MSKVLFVVGPPGAGKTTLVRTLLEPDSCFLTRPKWTLGPEKKVCAAGHYTGKTFDGADTVPYNGVADALGYWEENLLLRDKYELTIFDGDRFSNGPAVEAIKKTGVRLFCLHLSAPEEILAQRRRARGSNQNATWVKGRVTKALNFTRGFPGTVIHSEGITSEDLRGKIR